MGQKTNCPRCGEAFDGGPQAASRTQDEANICNKCSAEQAAYGLQRPGTSWGPLYERILWDIAHSAEMQNRLSNVPELRTDKHTDPRFIVRAQPNGECEIRSGKTGTLIATCPDQSLAEKVAVALASVRTPFYE